jgi:hypothetical protein
MRKSWISLASLTAGLVAVAAFTNACSGGGGGGGGTPTPTPLSITVDSFVDQSGTSAVNNLECLGFTVHEANHGFTPAVTMNFIDSTGVKVFTKDFGDEGSQSSATFPGLAISSNGSDFVFGGTSADLTTGPYPCLTLPALDPGSYGISVTQGTQTVTKDNVITMSQPQAEGATLGTANTIAPVMGSIAEANDFMFHPFTAGGGFTVVTMDSSGSGTFVPEVNLPPNNPPFTPGGPFVEVENRGFFSSDTTQTHPVPANIDTFNRGWDIAVIPTTVKGGQYEAMVRADTVGSGVGTGYNYQLSLSSSQTVTVTSHDTCQATPDFTSVGGVGGRYWFTADLSTGFAGDYNPNQAQTCSDRHVTVGANSGVQGPGPDAAYTVLLQNGQSIRAAAESETSDAVLYLVDSCTTVSTCRAAADIFGPADTDSLRYTNTTGAPQTLNLILDVFDPTQTPFKFNVYVEIK